MHESKRFILVRTAAIVIALSGQALWSQELLWDNDIGPPWGAPGGRATSPPAFPNIRVVDDFVVPNDGWIMSDFVATLLEDAAWEHSGAATVYVYDNDDGKPGSFFTDDRGLVQRVDAGMRFGRRALWFDVNVSIEVPRGTWWAGLRDGEARGEGTAYWTTSPEGGPQKSSTGYFSLDSGNTWTAETEQWHHAFAVWGFIPGKATDGRFREVIPVVFSGEPAGGVREIAESDDEYFQLTAALTSRISRRHNVVAEFETTLPVFALERLGLRAESSATHAGVRQEIALFDFDAQVWIVVDERGLGQNEDRVVKLESFKEPDRFVRDEDGKTRVRISAFSVGSTLSPHTFKLDELKLVVTYEPL